MNEFESIRHGNFTSSNVYRLCTSLKNGEPTVAFDSYVKEKLFERKLGRSIDIGAKSSSMTWGSFLEKRVFDNLSSDYQMTHKETLKHPKYDFWVGSPDFIIPQKKVSDLKCFEPKNFASYVLALLSEKTETIKEEHPKEYWQLVSNSMILNVPNAEAIVYMPYENEMEEIRELANDPEYCAEIGLQQWEVRFIQERSNKDLAVLPNNSKFKNLNIFEFKVPEEDKIFLEKRILMANDLIK